MAVNKVERTAPTLVQRALAGHAAIGLIAGALMYLIVLTGTLAVVAPRWERWEQPNVPEMTALSPAAVQRAVGEAARDRPASILIALPTAALPRASVTASREPYFLDRDGKRSVGVAHPWTEFLLALHINLNLPQTIGLIIVGALGSMLTALAITGVIAHPRIFRDAFRLRARANRQLAQSDWHNRLGVWTLPFTIAVAITGAFLGLAVAGATTLANEYHGGDIARTYAPIFGDQSAPGGSLAPVADVSAALSWMRANAPDAAPTYVSVAQPGTAGQRVQILADVPRRLIYGEAYKFDGSGRFGGKVGLSDGSLGQQAAASTYKLHFGNFGGPWVELAYVALGFCLTVVTATGMSLWLQKRRRRGEPSPRLEGFWAAVVWGVPILLIVAAWQAWLIPGLSPARTFWVGLAVLVTFGAAWPALMSLQALRLVLGSLLCVTAAASLATHLSNYSALVLDVVILAAGAGMVLARLAQGRDGRRRGSRWTARYLRRAELD